MTHYFLDTSVLMNIEDFQAQGHDNFGECVEYVTYYTILELEGLKKSKDSSKAFAARKALHYIEDNDVAILSYKKMNFWHRRELALSLIHISEPTRLLRMT